MNRNDVRQEALDHINDHLNIGNFSSTRDQYDVFERVVYMVRQVMAIKSPRSVVVRRSPKAKNGSATTHMYGLMLDHLQGMDMLHDLYSTRGAQPPHMIVLKMDDMCPANNAIGLVHVPASKDAAVQGVVVWISCQLKVTIMEARALPSLCHGYTEAPLETEQTERLFGAGFDSHLLDNLGLLIASLGRARNDLRRVWRGEDALAV